jgi:putative Holliday junction resolvase
MVQDHDHTDSQWVGFDPGRRRCGLAVADLRGKIALPLGVLPTEPRLTLGQRLLAALGERKLRGLVVGLPLDLHGEEGAAARFARELGAQLAEQLHCAPHFVDERFTTQAADARQREAGRRASQRRRTVDALAAAAILQAFLDQRAG